MAHSHDLNKFFAKRAAVTFECGAGNLTALLGQHGNLHHDWHVRAGAVAEPVVVLAVPQQSLPVTFDSDGIRDLSRRHRSNSVGADISSSSLRRLDTAVCQ